MSAIAHEHNALNQWFGNSSNSKIQIGHSFATTAEKTLSAHEHLFLTGDRQTHIYQVQTGVIGVYKMLSDGRRQIINFYYPGDVIGGEEQAISDQYAEALCDSRVRCIPHSTVESIMTLEPGFGQAMIAMLATELAETRDQLLSLGRKSALEKVATFLLRISCRNDRQDGSVVELHLPMSRGEIADYLGLTIETVSRNITKLKTEGVIRLASKSVVMIENMDRLLELAEGDG